MKAGILISAALLLGGCTLSVDVRRHGKVELTRKEAAAALKQRDDLIHKLAERLHKLEELQK